MDRQERLAGKALIWQAVQMGGVKGIFMIRLVVLARLLAPADFGLVAIATTAIGFLLNVTNFGMVPALVQGVEMDDDQYNAAWTIGVLRAAAITIFVALAAPLVADIFGEPQAVGVIRFLALNPLLEALSSIKVAALNRNLHFRPLAQLRLAGAAANAVISIVLARLYGVWGLAGGMLAASAIGTLISYILAPHQPRFSFDRDAIRPLIQYGRWIFINSLIAMAGSYILRIVITRQLGSAALGLYFLGAQLAFIPSEVASEVVGNVAFPLYARLQTNVARATQIFRAIYTSLAALLYPACALIFILAPGLVRDVLGPRWQGTEPVIQVLALVTLIGVFGDMAAPVLKGFGQPYRSTLIELVQSSMIIALVWVLTERFGLIGAALAWLPAVILSQFLNARYLRQILYRPFAGTLRPLLVVLALTVLCAIIAAAVRILIPGLIGVITAGGLAVLVTAALLWALDLRFSLGFRRNLILVFPPVAALIRIPSMDK